MIIDTRPQIVDLKCYGGDDLSLRVDVTGADYSTATWTAQVRTDHDSDVNATFTCTPDATGATLVLQDADTQALLNLGTPQQPVYGAPFTSSVLKYQGVWDVQVNSGGAIKTLVQGVIEVYADVTRAV
jgi:hypothetical protein